MLESLFLYFEYFRLVVINLVVITSAVNCLLKLVSYLSDI